MNAPDPSVFAAMPEGRDRPNGVFTLTCHGTLTRRLGLDVAIEAVALVRPRMPGLRLMV